MKKTIRRIKLRKGTDNQRKLVVFEEGEPVYITDKNHVYVGDNKTYGGTKASNKNLTTQYNETPEEATQFDIIYFESTGDTKILDKDGTLLPIKTNLATCCEKIKQDINVINDLINKIQLYCCNPDIRLITDDDQDILGDNNDWFAV
jgi:hypothetical protein